MRRNAVLVIGLIFAAPTFALAAGGPQMGFLPSSADAFAVEEICRTRPDTCARLDQPISPSERRIYVCYCGEEFAELIIGIQNLGQIYKGDLGRYVVPLTTGSAVADKSVNYFLVENSHTAVSLTTRDFKLVPFASIPGWQKMIVRGSESLKSQVSSIENLHKIGITFSHP